MADKSKTKAFADLAKHLGSSITSAARANAPYQSTTYDPNQDAPETTKRQHSGASNGAKYVDAFRSKTSNNGSINDNEDD